MPFAKCFSFHSKTVRQADSKLGNLQNLVAKGKQWHEMIPYGAESPLPPPQAPAHSQRTPEMDTFLPNSRDACCQVLEPIPSVRVHTYTKVFSKPAVDVYCFPSPQLAVKHLIQQL